MKLIIEKWSIPRRDWVFLNEREVAVKITPKRMEITDGLSRGLRFDLDGRCISRLETRSYRYRLERGDENK